MEYEFWMVFDGGGLIRKFFFLDRKKKSIEMCRYEQSQWNGIQQKCGPGW